MRLAERRLSLAVTPAAEAWLAHAGYDPAFGARPLRRVIQKQVEDPLALALLEGRYLEGSTVTVDVSDGARLLRKDPGKRGNGGSGDFLTTPATSTSSDQSSPVQRRNR